MPQYSKTLIHFILILGEYIKILQSKNLNYAACFIASRRCIPEHSKHVEAIIKDIEPEDS